MVGLGHGGSISNFADTYHEVFELAPSRHQYQIAIGTDTNGLFPLPGPDANATLRYGGYFPRATTGNRTWDVNTDGVAHYGLFSDFVRSWSSIVTDGEGSLEQDVFSGSAEGFAQMWEAVEEARASI